MSPPIATLAEAQALDAADSLAHHRNQFALPENTIYLIGNSLGALPKSAITLMHDVVTRQWGEGLVRSWNDADWINAPQRIGGKIAGLMGVAADEVIVADSVSVNIYKLLMAIAATRPGATHILTEAGNFHTDAHIAAGAARTMGLDLRLLERDAVLDAIAPDTAALLLTHVHYKSGARFDMAAVTAQAAALGVPVVWDLSHSIGAVPLDLGAAGAEYAVGCGYKFLNGGPGAPGFLYVAKPRQDALTSPLQGWFGHARPFAFEDDYTPAPGMDRWQVGTPPMLSLLVLEAGVNLMAAADRAVLWRKSQALFDLVAARMALRCPEFSAISPSDPDRRGSHISFRHPDAWPINRALIERGVIGDVRAPDVLRFGLTPLYLGYADVWQAVEAVADVVESGVWREPRFAVVTAVT